MSWQMMWAATQSHLVDPTCYVCEMYTSNDGSFHTSACANEIEIDVLN